jgi:hypothetical protein
VAGTKNYLDSTPLALKLLHTSFLRTRGTILGGPHASKTFSEALDFIFRIQAMVLFS